MTSAAEIAFAALADRARRDEEVVGLVVGGGRGKGLVTQWSDFDVYLVVDRESAVERYLSQAPLVEVLAMTLDVFRSYADFGTASAWNRYNFAHLIAVIDKSGGEVQRILDGMEYMPPQVVQQVAADSLDGYLNFCYRSVKNARDGNTLAALLDAAGSVPHLLDFIFAIERRVKPYNKFLAWELRQHPLVSTAWANTRLPHLLEPVIRVADLGAQGVLYRQVVKTAREQGLDAVVDAWGDEALGVLDALAGHAGPDAENL